MRGPAIEEPVEEVKEEEKMGPLRIMPPPPPAGEQNALQLQPANAAGDPGGYVLQNSKM